MEITGPDDEVPSSIVHAREAQPARNDDKLPWIRWEKMVVFAPADILEAYSKVKNKTDA
jgi:hypothetical protein